MVDFTQHGAGLLFAGADQQHVALIQHRAVRVVQRTRRSGAIDDRYVACTFAGGDFTETLPERGIRFNPCAAQHLAHGHGTGVEAQLLEPVRQRRAGVRGEQQRAHHAGGKGVALLLAFFDHAVDGCQYVVDGVSDVLTQAV